MLILLIEIKERVPMGEHRLYVREKKSIEEGQNPDHESIQNSFLYGN